MSSGQYERQFDETPDGAMVKIPDVMISKNTGCCWGQRTLLEKILMLIVLILFILLIVFVLLDAIYTMHGGTDKSEYCLTPTCVTVASSVINSMNATADPCEDFYEYACGGWIKANPLPKGEKRWGTFSVLAKKNQIVLKNAIEKPAESFRNKAERKAKDYYTACMDANKTIEQLGNQPIMQLLQDIGGALDNTTSIDFNSTISAIMRHDITVLFSFSVGTDEKLYHLLTVSAVQDMMPFLDVLGVMNNLSSLVGFTITGSQSIVVYSPSYLSEMSRMVTDLLRTDEGTLTLKYYLYWRFVKGFTPYLSSPFVNALNIYNKAVTGSTGPEDRWRVCVSNTGGTVGYALGAMFVRAAFQTGSKHKAETMISEIKMAFKNNLPNLKWMDADTRLKAIDKANAVIDMIGYPQYILNSSQLEEHYQELTIDSGTYFWNAVRSYLWGAKLSMKRLLEKPDRYKWEMTPQTVNAYYEPTKNEIVFPAGILQGPFYDQHYPKSLNFGAMGVVMGHELTHGFDDQGREYDKYGNLRSWWDKTIVDNFKKKAQCIVDQYSKYSINGDHVNGKNTLGENIADNGGLKSAYNAYMDWIKQNGEERNLPGTSLTHRQLFFIGFSRVWCSTQSDEYTKLIIKTNEHSPGKFRVIGTLSNSQEFADNFKCAPGSRMNPKNKCEVW